MGTNGNGQFLESELIHRKVKVDNEWQTSTFPVVGGRLRILHENNDHLGIQTEIIRLDTDFVVVKAAVESQRGKFNGTGTASGQRDAKLADSLVELAETRAIARALRFGGIGVEYTGAEEVSHVAAADSEKEQSWQQSSLHQYSLKTMATAKWQRKRQVALRLRQDQNRKVAAMERQPRHSESLICAEPKSKLSRSRHWRDACPLRGFPL